MAVVSGKAIGNSGPDMAMTASRLAAGQAGGSSRRATMAGQPADSPQQLCLDVVNLKRAGGANRKPGIYFANRLRLEKFRKTERA
jgi:hypothetical protein